MHLPAPPPPVWLQVKEHISHLSLQLPDGHVFGRSFKLQGMLASYFQVTVRCICPTPCL